MKNHWLMKQETKNRGSFQFVDYWIPVRSTGLVENTQFLDKIDDMLYLKNKYEYNQILSTSGVPAICPLTGIKHNFKANIIEADGK